MTTWEYKIVDSADVPPGTAGQMRSFRLNVPERGRDAVEAYLNQLGAEGWEIISIAYPTPDGSERFVGIAKRERL